MRRIVAAFLVRLYPRGWRERYGEEFRALLEDAPPGWSALFDLCGGAMRMQLSSWSFTRLALATSLTGLLAGFGGSFLITPRYSSSAEMMIKAGDFDAPVPPHGNLTEYFMQLENEVLSRTSLSSVIQDPRLDLYKRDRAVLPLEDVIEAMRKRSVRIEPALSPGLTGNDTFSFNVRFDYPDPHKAQQVVQALIAQFQKINRERQRETVQAKQTFDKAV